LIFQESMKFGILEIIIANSFKNEDYLDKDKILNFARFIPQKLEAKGLMHRGK